MNNFNLVAPIYDALAYLVFGKAIDTATSVHLRKIKVDSKVLVLGGGTGKVLEKIPKCDSILFLDSSDKMVSRARRRVVENQVEFVVVDFKSLELSKEYDVIVCPFFLDCFSEETLQKVLDKISDSLSKNGILEVVDFQGSSTSLLLGAMHLFFRLFARLESKRLLNIHEFILQKNFSVQSEEFFHKNMIFSRVYGNL